MALQYLEAELTKAGSRIEHLTREAYRQRGMGKEEQADDLDDQRREAEVICAYLLHALSE
jgi:hypothetical protein